MPETPLRILSLGDSYTAGEAVEASERWPIQLAALIRSAGRDAVEPFIIARTGWTTEELGAAIDEASPPAAWDLVTLQIGVNDQYRGRGSGTYREGFSRLLTAAVERAGSDATRVLVLSIPDWGVTPFAAERIPSQIAAEIDEYNAINRGITLERGARYLDITGISRSAAERPALLASDGLHPSGAMYALWAEAALPIALEAVRTD